MRTDFISEQLCALQYNNNFVLFPWSLSILLELENWFSVLNHWTRVSCEQSIVRFYKCKRIMANDVSPLHTHTHTHIHRIWATCWVAEGAGQGQDLFPGSLKGVLPRAAPGVFRSLVTEFSATAFFLVKVFHNSLNTWTHYRWITNLLLQIMYNIASKLPCINLLLSHFTLYYNGWLILWHFHVLLFQLWFYK